MTTGLPTTFVRLTGCPLRCTYCDTAYAFSGGTSLSLDDVVSRVDALGVKQVTVTGGEPLAQPNCLFLLRRLCDQGYRVSLETSGERDIAAVDPRVVRVMDLKTPGSGEVERNRWENIGELKPKDQVKFVICDRADYEWARRSVKSHALDERCEVLFSPVWETLKPEELAAWILDDGLAVRFQIQLHKVLWGDQPGR